MLKGQLEVVHVLLEDVVLARVQELQVVVLLLAPSSLVGVVVELTKNVLNIEDLSLVEHDLLFGILQVLTLIIVRNVTHDSKSTFKCAKET